MDFKDLLLGDVIRNIEDARPYPEEGWRANKSDFESILNTPIKYLLDAAKAFAADRSEIPEPTITASVAWYSGYTESENAETA